MKTAHTGNFAESADAIGDTRPATPNGAEDRARREDMNKLLDAVVMVVDDEPLNIEVTQIHLEEAGYTKFVSTSDPL
ncbi:MAG TPA: hypothetical protein VGP15_17340, partial [Burkholderiales bacterium]|nr:hypothetical protein [Burkholderiales bacterium]